MTINIKNHLPLFATLVLLLSATACKKTVIDTITSPNARPLLSKIEFATNHNVIFGYNSNNLLDHYRMANDNYIEEAHFAYDAAKKPFTGIMNGFELTFIYKGAQVDKIEFRLSGSTTLDHYTQFSYQNGLVSQTLTYINNQPAVKMLYTYEANGDMKTMEYDYLTAPNHYDLVERTEFEYDTKVNAIQAADEVMYVLGLPKAAHNIKKSVLYDASNQVNETKSYSLNYNDFGMPTVGIENTTYPNSPGLNRSVKFSYQ